MNVSETCLETIVSKYNEALIVLIILQKSLTFRDSYHIVGKLVDYCNKNNKALNDCNLSEFKEFSILFEEDIYQAIALNTCLNQRKVLGGPSEEEVKRQTKQIEEFIIEEKNCQD